MDKWLKNIPSKKPGIKGNTDNSSASQVHLVNYKWKNLIGSDEK